MSEVAVVNEKEILAANVTRFMKNPVNGNTDEIKQSDLAKASKLTQPQISKLLSKNLNPTLKTLSKVASALGVSLSDLFTEPN